MKRTLLALCLLGCSACDDDTLPTDTTRTPPDAAALDDAESTPDAAFEEDARVIGFADASEPGASPKDAGADGNAADGALDASDTTGASENCPAYSQRSVIEVPPGVLASNLFHWTCDNIYVLNGAVFVHTSNAQDPQILTIAPGTLIRGKPESFLVVTRNARIEAEGTRAEPIVFTSAQPVGARKREDWGGVTLLGRGYRSLNPEGRAVEGLPASIDTKLLAYGPLQPVDAGVADAGSGGDAGNALDAEAPRANDGHSCGTLRYVRVEFASHFLKAGVESNGVQVYGCGYETELDYLQVHMSGDDGLEIFGGSVDVRHLLVTGAADDSFDFDEGWRGRAQFVVLQQHPDLADLGIESGPGTDSESLAPNARLFNMTMIGTNGAANGKVGVRFRGGSRAVMRNAIFLGFTSGAIDVGGAKASDNFRDKSLSVDFSVFFEASAMNLFPVGSTDDTADDRIDEAFAFFGDLHNRQVDPKLPAPFDVLEPRFVPPGNAPLGAQYAETPSERAGDEARPFFDTRARYVGAFAPGGEDWTLGWAAYPAN